MKYFTKYLPVDGKVSGGDKACISSTGQLLGFEGGDSHAKALDKDGYKPARLFLCSRDIGVGDKFLFKDEEYVHVDQRDNIPYWIHGVKEDSQKGGVQEVICLDAAQCFKVIGEISPAATWVREGTEFEEGEVAWDCSETGDPFLMGFDFAKPHEYYNGFVYIKCPTCQVFH